MLREKLKAIFQPASAACQHNNCGIGSFWDFGLDFRYLGYEPDKSTKP